MRIEEYSPQWQTKLSAMADTILGAGFFEKPSQIDRDSESCVFVAIDDDGEVAGFVRGRLLPKNGLQDFLEHKVDDIPEDLEDADAKGVLGVIQTVAVAPGQQGQGLGTKLLQVIHDTIIGRGADKLIVSFKRGHRASHVDRLMAKLGFDFWLTLETYWKQRCDLGEFVCIDRGASCTCEALLYRKKVF